MFIINQTLKPEKIPAGKQLDLSLKHLGMDYVDLYIYHMCVYNAA